MEEFEFEWIGEEVQRVRRQRGWTQADLGAQVGKSQAHISKIEKGLTFDWPTIKLICTKLDIPLEDVKRAILGLPATESAIAKDPMLTVEDRGLLLEVYKLLQKRGPHRNLAA
jgi:transcriptional regulator with XRE-family HTH domain